MKVGVMKLVLALCLLGCTSTVFSQDTSLPAPSSQDTQADTAPSPITDLGDEYENSIKLLQNRFRIDYNVKEVSMIFFREYGSAPVVLVRPDGSKLFQGRVDETNVKWFDADTFDMITIENPMPGPWQAVGQVNPASRVMVISDIKLHATSLPSILFSGEILKSTAYLTNGGEKIDNKQFRDVVELSIEFVSANDPNYDNFGANDAEIAKFEDNGRGMDERPMDGVFTGQFNLKVAAGKWQPVYRVDTPMFTREQIGAPIILYNNPVYVDVELDATDGTGDGYHTLLIDVNRELVNIESLLIDGKIKFPNADIQNFSLTEGGDSVREHLIVAYEEGVYRVKLTAYGTTSEGRDFILDVPEYTFVAEAPEPEVIDPLIDGEDPIVDGSEDPLAMGDNSTSLNQENTQSMAEDDEMDSGTLTLIILAVNGTIILIGVIAAVIIILKRRKASGPASAKAATTKENKKAKKKVVSESDLSLDNEPKGFKKLLAKFKKSKPAE
ncbi:TIGR03503 family protein [Alteromonas sp. KS69]|uniref:TIGR03503 family protein n=1 Tax=Alteromonas sp. KS69 TaxID=2109917 RepID=UPI000F8808C2|nr:TIGR03503 family protein [Alteromonas sp. KS69]RUP81867.1 TIGR03503 family protein [Alteromonas sp. KS69]